MLDRPNEGSNPGAVAGQSTVARDYLSLTGARALTAALSLVSIVITTRILTPPEYALVAYVAVVAAIIFGLAAQWTSTSVTRYGREDLDRRGTFVEISWARLAIALPLATAGVAVLIGVWAIGVLPPEFTLLYVVLAAAYAIALVFDDHVLAALHASGRFGLSGGSTIARQLCVVIAVGTIALSGLGASPAAVSAVIVSASLLAIVPAVPAIWKLAVWPLRLERSALRRIVVFSIPLIAFTVSLRVMAAVDLITVRAFGSAEEAGVYALAYQAYLVAQYIGGVATAVLVPLIVSLLVAHRQSVVGTFFDRVVPQSLFLSSVGAGLAATLLPLAVPLVFGAEFRAVQSPLALLLVAAALYHGAAVLTPILVAKDMTRALALIGVAAAAINVAGDLLLVGLADLGGVGAALATDTTMAFVLAAYWLVARRTLGSGARPQALVLAPLLGVVPIAVFESAASSALGAATTIIAALAVLRIAQPFRRSDAALVTALRLPRRAEIVALRAVSVLSRGS
jgi:O-antigen/teichoic acid export membrane protein